MSSKDDRETADDERTIGVEACPDANPTWDPRDGEDLDDNGELSDAEKLDTLPCRTKTTDDRQANTGRVARPDAATSDAGLPLTPTVTRTTMRRTPALRDSTRVTAL